MSINSVGFSNSYICFCGSSITEATRRKLIALGIDPSTVSSEAEARAIIERVLEARKNAGLPVPFEEEKNKIKQNITTQTEENSENMMSMLNYDSNLKRIMLGL